ncbi:hypothetical protein BLOT_006232 [Blomia tropicalis]|nr:hypothetical protein BLOT_006232 [Blomia tropicalis]
MNLIKLIITIQILLAFLCLLIQIYALASNKWTLFESRVELGLIEEHGHYGLWSICTNKLIPVELIDDGRMYGVANCEPMNTFFKPTHYRPLIAVFCLAHLASLFGYTFLLMIRLMEIIIQESNRYNENDLETNQSHAKRFMVISARYFTTNQSGQSREEKVKRQIRIKLYIISLAAASTALALLSAIAPYHPLRDSDIFRINNVSSINYRSWRGSGFWAQLTTLIMDMLITSLIAIEVRVLFVLQQQQQQQQQNRQQQNQQSIASKRITTTCSTNDHSEFDSDVFINPFVQGDNVSTMPKRIISSIQETTSFGAQSQLNDISLTHRTEPKFLLPNSTDTAIASTSSNNNHNYVNSNEVRQLKKLMLNNQKSDKRIQSSQLSEIGVTAYCNPIFTEIDQEQHSSSNC